MAFNKDLIDTSKLAAAWTRKHVSTTLLSPSNATWLAVTIYHLFFCFLFSFLIFLKTDITTKSETAQLRATQFNSEKMQLQTSFPLHLNNTHSVYVAVGTLLSAIVIVVLMVTLWAHEQHWQPVPSPRVGHHYFSEIEKKRNRRRKRGLLQFIKLNRLETAAGSISTWEGEGCSSRKLFSETQREISSNSINPTRRDVLRGWRSSLTKTHIDQIVTADRENTHRHELVGVLYRSGISSNLQSQSATLHSNPALVHSLSTSQVAGRQNAWDGQIGEEKKNLLESTKEMKEKEEEWRKGRKGR